MAEKIGTALQKLVWDGRIPRYLHIFCYWRRVCYYERMPRDLNRKAEQAKLRRRELRKQWFNSMGGCCVKCGSTEDLEVDHINESDKVSHNVWSWSKENRDKELHKCQPLCKSCHAEKTRTFLIKHGQSRYCAGCRCDVCKLAKSIANKRRVRDNKGKYLYYK